MTELLRFTGARKRDPAIDAWFATQPAELRALAELWFSRLRSCGPNIRELMHDGLATVCADDAPFAYVGVFRAHVNVGFFHGDRLPDPRGLLQGTGKRMRHVKVKPSVAVDDEALTSLIEAAYRDISRNLLLIE